MKKIILFFVTCFSIINLQVNAQLFQNTIGKATPVEYGVSTGWIDDSLLWIMANYRINYSSSTTVPAFMRLRINGTVQFARQYNLPITGSARGIWLDDVVNTSKKSIGTISAVGWRDDSLLWVIRGNNSGGVLWSRQLSNNSFASTSGLRIKTAYNTNGSINGFYILATHFSGQGEVLIKLNNSGSTLWQKRVTHGTSGYRYVFRDLQVTSDRGCIVTGYQESSSGSNPVLFKFSSSGDVSWARSYDFFSSLYSGGFGVAITPTGYAVTGSETGGANLTFATNTTGVVTWANKYSSASINDMQSNGIVSDASGNLIFTGNNLSPTTPALLVKLTSAGNVTFGRTYYGHADMSDIKLSHNGYCAIGTSEPSNVNANIYIINTDVNGNIAAGCNPATVSITKTAPEFTNTTNASYNLVNETMINAASTVTTSTISTQQNRCGTANLDIVATSDKIEASKFNAYADWSSHRIKFEYKTKENERANYEVTIYNINGMVVGKKTIQPNQMQTMNMPDLMDGLYSAILTKNDKIVSRQNVLWGRQ